MLNNIKRIWPASATLLGSIVGAGIFGIPYAIAQAGLVPGLIMIFFIGSAVMLVHLMIAEVMLRTHYRHQIPGLVEKYLGKPYKVIDAIGIILGGYGALTAYIIGEGQIWGALTGHAEWSQYFSYGFWLFGIIIILIGLKAIRKINSYVVGVVVFLIVTIFLFSLGKIDVANYQYQDWGKLWASYGVLLFAFSGVNGIFSLRDILRGEEKLVRPAILLSSVMSMGLYLLFTVTVLGVTGLATTEVASIGLVKNLGPVIFYVSNILAAITMTTSFLMVGVSLKQIFRHDYKMPNWFAWILSISVPIIIYALTTPDFIKILQVTGALVFGLTGVLIVCSFWKAKTAGDQKPIFSLPKLRLPGVLLIILFLAGILYTLAKLAG